jgi:hypothetical protein
MQYSVIDYKSILKQVFSHDKRPLGIFLAAGCPLSIRTNDAPLIPDITGLTSKIKDESSEVKGFITIFDKLRETSGKSPTVEDILSYVRLLRQVYSNDTLFDLSIEDINNLEKNICDKIEEQVNKELPTEASPYHEVASWIGSINREYPVEIFTTNYDLLIEQALEDRGVPYFDGFIGVKKAFFDPHAIEEDLLPTRWARIWKLHGSINWRKGDTSHHVWRGGTESGGSSLIHPSHLKYDESRKMPYLVMMDRLKNFLKQPESVLVTCGYSFGDQHINEVISQGLQGNPDSTMFGLLYGFLEDYPEATKLAKNRNNLILLAKDKSVIGRQEREWDGNMESRQNDSDRTSECEFNLGDFKQFAEFLNEIHHND